MEKRWRRSLVYPLRGWRVSAMLKGSLLLLSLCNSQAMKVGRNLSICCGWRHWLLMPEWLIHMLLMLTTVTPENSLAPWGMWVLWLLREQKIGRSGSILLCAVKFLFMSLMFEFSTIPPKCIGCWRVGSTEFTMGLCWMFEVTGRMGKRLLYPLVPSFCKSEFQLTYPSIKRCISESTF